MSNVLFSDLSLETAKYLKALGHPVRLAILKHLNSGEIHYISELLILIPMAQSTISQHLKELKNAGLIEGTLELPKIRYEINQATWQRAKRAIESLLNEDFNSISYC